MRAPSHEIPTVLTDLDGVKADFDQRVLEQLTARHPQIEIAATRTNFYICDDYPDHVELIRSISDEQGFFSSLQLVDGAIEGWQQMLEAGYHPMVCSSPISTNPFCRDEKLGWLEEHFVPVLGSWVVDEAIITKNKEEYGGIALIDDRPEVRNADIASWQHIIFDRPYNQQSVQPRLYGWRDSNLLQLLKAAEVRAAQS